MSCCDQDQFISNFKVAAISLFGLTAINIILVMDPLMTSSKILVPPLKTMSRDVYGNSRDEQITYTIH